MLLMLVLLVTFLDQIHAADYCTNGCQENYPDEFCSKYPPEGIPAKPRTIDDWGTNFNITSNMMQKGMNFYMWGTLDLFHL